VLQVYFAAGKDMVLVRRQKNAEASLMVVIWRAMLLRLHHRFGLGWVLLDSRINGKPCAGVTRLVCGA
jgi:hypothetical protein